MTTAITMLPNVETGAACPVGEAVRVLITELARDEGPTALPFPGLAVCRYTAPTLYDKAATAGTTVGAVLQGAKQLRIGSRALTVSAGRMVVVTRPAPTRARSWRPAASDLICRCRCRSRPSGSRGR
ncbi:MAG TPA: AraC family transcriptional regulator N-terminal domain-containing protein [Polyangia bacterium]|nr:AraC family transcriptional regulator N-terminal domain-containing protein [Polyangia bacterium]